jgi:hypothetical protein
MFYRKIQRLLKKSRILSISNKLIATSFSMGLPHNAVKYGERLFSVSAAGMFVHSDNQIKGEGFIIGKENGNYSVDI